MNDLEIITKIVKLEQNLGDLNKKINQFGESWELVIKSINERLSGLERK